MTRGKKAEKVEVVAPEVAPEDVPQFTLREAAEQIGIHRVTLKRYEDRGVIPRARWARHPQPHRVYSLNEIKKMKLIIEAMQQHGDRVYVDVPVQAAQ